MADSIRFRSIAALLAVALMFFAGAAGASQNIFAVKGDQLTVNGRPFKVLGLRCSNALISDATERQLIENLDGFRACGVNTVSVYLMGSRFGDVKGYRPDATLEPAIAARLGRIIEAADARGMIVLVGCLYWGDSRASEELHPVWTQTEANHAIANTVNWLKAHDYRNVFVDPDNEGMAHRGAGFDIGAMIDAAHAADPTIAVAWNDASAPSKAADLLIHHSPRVKGRPWLQSEGAPGNAPGGYWGSYSKRKGLYQYLNIGVYTDEMKEDLFRQTRRDTEEWNGFMLASTWLQCVAPESPQQNPGGDGTAQAPGVRWWLEFVKKQYEPWTPPAPAATKTKKTAKAAAKTPPAEARGVGPGGFMELAVHRAVPADADPLRGMTCWVNCIRPDGSRIDQCRGFYGGGDAWRFRFPVDQAGVWRYGIHFAGDPDARLTAGGAFTVKREQIVPPAPLAQLAGNPIWFGLAGGRPILLRSLHAGDRFFAANWPAEKRKAFLDWAQAQGYNMLSVASCLLNRRAAGRGAEWQTPQLWNDRERRPNPAEYDKLESILDDLVARRIYLHPFAGFFGQSSNFPQDPADQERYLSYTITRLGPYWNMLFNVAGPEPLNHAQQFYGKMSAGEITRLGLLIRGLDGSEHLLGVHNPPGDDPFAHSGWSTYVTLQGWKDRNWRNIYDGMLKNHADKPLLAHEVFWPGNTLGHGEFTDAEIRKKAWVLLMAAATINFGDMKGNSSSGFSGTLELGDRIQKRHDIVKQAWDLFASFPFDRMRPMPELARGAFLMGEAGRHYLAYLPEGGEAALEIESEEAVQAQWINPAQPGDRRPAVAVEGKRWRAPDSGDWLLEIRFTNQ